jgi:hypothetical protein
MQLIHYIASHPEYTNIVINDERNRPPIHAIERVSSDGWQYEDSWGINQDILSKNTLLVNSK